MLANAKKGFPRRPRGIIPGRPQGFAPTDGFPPQLRISNMHYEFRILNYYGIAPTDGHLNNYELKIMHYELKKGVILTNHAFFLLMV